LKKIVVTARDPASANDIYEILPDLLNNRLLQVKILAQNPAYKIFLDKLTHEEVAEFDLVLFEFSRFDQDNGKFVTGIFDKFKPDILLTGISGPDSYGIDEIALKTSAEYGNKVKTFSVQSYWGDLNESCGVLAQNIFVLDTFAKDVTISRCKGCNIIITGPLQSKRYDSVDIEKERKIFREKHLKHKDSEIKIIGLFGQPLFEYDWYIRTMSLFIDQLNQIKMDIVIAYKIHPKESKKSINWIISKLKQSKINYFVVKEKNILKVLPGTDIVASLFSTVGYDLQNLLARSKNKFSIPVYLFFDNNCRDWFYEYCKLDEIPLAKYEGGVVIKQKSELNNLYSIISEAGHNSKRDNLFFYKNETHIDIINNILINE